MKNTVKVILLIFILLFTSFTFCFNYSSADNSIDENTQTTTQDTQTTTQDTQTTNEATQITTTVSTTNSPDDEIFSKSNIINILLIAVGIVIILLAIAILTKLKN